MSQVAHNKLRRGFNEEMIGTPQAFGIEVTYRN